MKRNIEKDLLIWKESSNRKPLVLLGVRQCGKSYIIEDFCKKNFKNFVTINLFKEQKFIDIYNNTDTYEMRKQLLFYSYDVNLKNPDTILFVDEVQKCPLFIQDLKIYCEEGFTNIIVAGSLLSVTLKKMNESYPVGKTNIKFMYPMNFKEFLEATHNERFIPLLKESFINNKEFVFHDLLMDLFYKYMFLGGMPEMIQNYLDNNFDISNCDFNILSNIVLEYERDITKHIETEKDKLRAHNIYSNIAPQLLKENPKFMYAKFDKKERKNDYISALDWLVTSRVVIKCNQITKPEYPIKGFVDANEYKLFFSDVGLLRKKVGIDAIDIFLNGNYSYKGVLVENYVALELLNQFNDIFYYSKKGNENNSQLEVDFIIQLANEVIPIEVKSGNNRTQSLKSYNELFHPKIMLKICNANFGKKDNIKTIPLYAVFLINELLPNELIND